METWPWVMSCSDMSLCHDVKKVFCNYVSTCNIYRSLPIVIKDNVFSGQLSDHPQKRSQQSTHQSVSDPDMVRLFRRSALWSEPPAKRTRRTATHPRLGCHTHNTDTEKSNHHTIIKQIYILQNQKITIFLHIQW